MSKYAGEKVLVVPRKLLETIGIFQGIKTDQLDAAIGHLMEPAEALYFANPGPDGKFNKDYAFHWADFDNEPIKD